MWDAIGGEWVIRFNGLLESTSGTYTVTANGWWPHLIRVIR